MSKFEANLWHKVFIVFPKPVYTLSQTEDKRYVSVKYKFLCTVERRFSVVKGTFHGVEYREHNPNPHAHCVNNCYAPGCEAPIHLDLKRLHVGRKDDSSHNIPVGDTQRNN